MRSDPVYMRAAVLMSGGVDSSVSAYLLKKEGYDVVGLTMKVWQDKCMNTHSENCCGPRSIIDVRNVCKKLDIPFYIIDYQEEFRKEVIDYFCGEYSRGRTPNPCVVCNDRLKFGSLIAKAEGFGAGKVATGHYARIEQKKVGGKKRFVLRKGSDPKKDQTYFLFNLTQKQLAKIIMPVGKMEKNAVRRIAKELGLSVHDKPDSVEICFIPGNDYKEFLKAGKVKTAGGNIVHKDGRVLGRHEGIEFFTVGQRRGIGIAGEKPYYVIKVESETNTVIVGDNNDLLRKEFYAEHVNWILIEDLKKAIRAEVKIRYNSPAVKCRIEPADSGRVKVVFDSPQRAVTPGQAAVFYKGEYVVGGGWIGK